LRDLDGQIRPQFGHWGREHGGDDELVCLELQILRGFTSRRERPGSEPIAVWRPKQRLQG
jgi:hypothetical protein